jgi:hypothetical protein
MLNADILWQKEDQASTFVPLKIQCPLLLLGMKWGLRPDATITQFCADNVNIRSFTLTRDMT